MPCSSTNDVTVNVDLIRLDSGDFRVTLNRGANSDVSLLGASLKFTIGPNYDTALQTVPDGDFDKTTETADQLVAVFSINENLLANSLPKQDTQLYFVFTVTAANARATQATLRGAINYKDSFPADGPIVVPETVGPTTIVRYSEVDPRNGTEGQALIQNANGVFVPTTFAGGGGSPVSSVFGRTGIIVAENGDYTFAQIGSKPTTVGGFGITDAVTQSRQIIAGTGLDGTGDLSTDLTLSLNAATQASLLLADSALQPAAIGNTIQAYSAILAGINGLTLTGQSGNALAVNGTENGYILTAFATAAEGVLAGTALQPGDNISELTNNAGYTTFDGAYSSLSGIPSSFPPSAHNQAFSTITATPTTLAGYGITDAATSAQGALATTALQPGDNLSTLTNDAGYLTTALQTADIGVTVQAWDADLDALAALIDPAGKLTGIEPLAEVNNISDLNATALTGGGDTALHQHDGRYYTETEVDALLGAKLDAAGVIYQRQATQRGETTTQVEHTSVWVDIVSVPITPIAADSVIELSSIIQVFYSAASGGLRILRDATPIYDPSPADATGPFLIGFGASGYAAHIPVPISTRDSPNTTSQVTYKVQGRRFGATGTFRSTTAGASQNSTSFIEAREMSG